MADNVACVSIKCLYSLNCCFGGHCVSKDYLPKGSKGCPMPGGHCPRYKESTQRAANVSPVQYAQFWMISSCVHLAILCDRPYAIWPRKDCIRWNRVNRGWRPVGGECTLPSDATQPFRCILYSGYMIGYCKKKKTKSKEYYFLKGELIYPYILSWK